MASLAVLATHPSSVRLISQQVAVSRESDRKSGPVETEVHVELMMHGVHLSHVGKGMQMLPAVLLKHFFQRPPKLPTSV